MDRQPTTNTQVAACTRLAAHRRDHVHALGGTDACHPHVVEVVHLGHDAVCVCHDCGLDSGFVPRREAEALAAGHRESTRDGSARLRSA